MHTKNNTSAFMLYLVIFFLVSQLLLAIVIQLFPGVLFNPLWFVIIAQLVSLILPLFIWLKIKNDKFSRHMPRQPLGARNMVHTLLLSFLILPTMWLVSGISSLFVENNISEFLGSFEAPPLWLMLLAIAVTPGIVEEVVFRGYVQSTQHGQGVKKIVLMNGLFFAIIHLDIHQFFYTFALGAVFAYMVYYTKNIWAGIIPHFIVNGVNVLISHSVSGANGYVTDVATSPTLGESMYDAFRETNPELAQQMYDLLANVSDIAVAIAFMAVLTAITLPFAIWILFALRQYNTKARLRACFVQTTSLEDNRNAVLAKAETPPIAEDITEDGEIETILPPETIKTKFTIDWCLVALIAFYIFIVFIMPLLY